MLFLDFLFHCCLALSGCTVMLQVPHRSRGSGRTPDWARRGACRRACACIVEFYIVSSVTLVWIICTVFTKETLKSLSKASILISRGLIVFSNLASVFYIMVIKYPRLWYAVSPRCRHIYVPVLHTHTRMLGFCILFLCRR